MNNEKEFAEVAAMLGDRSRATMLWHLLDGRAFTASELSVLADVSPQSASNHLSLLVKANFLSVERQGRHRYYRFASEEVAHAIESLASLGESHSARGIVQEPLGIKYARTCYDHLAGKIAVDIAASLLERKFLRISSNQFVLTESGAGWFQSNGINIDQLEDSRRPLIRTCLDWSERKFHMAGSIGASLLNIMIEQDWIRRKRNTREVLVTNKGKKEIESQFKIRISS